MPIIFQALASSSSANNWMNSLAVRSGHVTHHQQAAASTDSALVVSIAITSQRGSFMAGLYTTNRHRACLGRSPATRAAYPPTTPVLIPCSV